MRPHYTVLAAFLATASAAQAADPIRVVIPPGLKAITVGKPPPSHELPSVGQAIKMAPRVAATYAQGTGALVGSLFSRKFGGFDRALKTANALSAQRLAKMPAEVAADLAGVLLKGKWTSTDAARADAGRQFLRVLTGRGRDAGHVQGILSRMGIFTNDEVSTKLDAASAAEFHGLMAELAPEPGDWSSFRSFAENATGAVARGGNDVQLLVDGSTYFPALKGAIDGAKKFILMEKFAIHDDESGRAVMGKVGDAAKRGVFSQVQYDAVGSMASDPALFAETRETGAQVLRSKAGSPLAGSLNHRKNVVIDGKVAFVGGMNLGTEYESIWHDIQSKITGPMVSDLAQIALNHQRQDGGKISRGMRKQIRTSLAETSSTLAGELTALAVNHVGLKDQNQKVLYLQATRLATKRVWIENPYLTDDHMVDELVAAAERGADVRVILPARNDEKLLAWGERARFTKLLGAGVKVYQYVGKDLNNPQMAHGKVALFDDQLATIGSSNLDQRSLKNNHEANIWVEGSTLNQQLAGQVFERDFLVSKQVVAYDPKLFDKVEDEVLRKESRNL